MDNIIKDIKLLIDKKGYSHSCVHKALNDLDYSTRAYVCRILGIKYK